MQQVQASSLRCAVGRSQRRPPLAPASVPAGSRPRAGRIAAAAGDAQAAPVDAAAGVIVPQADPGTVQQQTAPEDTTFYSREVEQQQEEEEEVDLLPETAEAPTLSQSVGQLWDKPLVKGAVITAGGFLGITLAIGIYKTWVIYNSSRNRRKRTVDKNLIAVETLNEYCPGNRAALNSGVIRGITSKTGFAKDLVFRKYLRYILNERPFDTDAVEDVLALRAACGLSDKEVAAVIKEVAERTFKKTGILMRRPKGMTAEGLARKVQGRAVFSKLLFLAEMEGLLAAVDRDAVSMTLLETFGATSDDAASLRIPSLKEMTVDDLERMWAAGGKDMEGDAAPAEGGAAPAGDAPAAGGAADGGSLGGDAGGDGGN